MMPRILVRTFHVSRRTGDGGAVAPGDILTDEKGQRVAFLSCSSPTKIRVRVRPGLELERPPKYLGVRILEDVRSVPTANRRKGAVEPVVLEREPCVMLAEAAHETAEHARGNAPSPIRTSLLVDAFAALRLLLAAQAPTAGELAKALGRPRSSVERLVQALEEAGIGVAHVRSGKLTFLSARRKAVLAALGLSQ